MVDLGILPGYNEGRPWGINNHGIIAGTCKKWDPASPGSLLASRAGVWETGTVRELPTIGGPYVEAVAINNLGHIVSSVTDTNGQSHPALWVGGALTDLGIPSGFLGAFAHDINDRDEITYSASDGNYRSFLWRNGISTEIHTWPSGTGVGMMPIDNQSQITSFFSSSGAIGIACLWANGTVFDLLAHVSNSDGIPFLQVGVAIHDLRSGFGHSSPILQGGGVLMVKGQSNVMTYLVAAIWLSRWLRRGWAWRRPFHSTAELWTGTR